MGEPEKVCLDYVDGIYSQRAYYELLVVTDVSMEENDWGTHYADADKRTLYVDSDNGIVVRDVERYERWLTDIK